jgi:hypothetical protein
MRVHQEQSVEPVLQLLAKRSQAKDLVVERVHDFQHPWAQEV